MTSALDIVNSSFTADKGSVVIDDSEWDGIKLLRIENTSIKAWNGQNNKVRLTQSVDMQDKFAEPPFQNQVSAIVNVDITTSGSLYVNAGRVSGANIRIDGSRYPSDNVTKVLVFGQNEVNDLSVETSDYKGIVYVVGRNITDLTADSMLTNVYTYGNLFNSTIYADADIVHRNISHAPTTGIASAYLDWVRNATDNVELANVSDVSRTGTIDVQFAGSVRNGSFVAQQRVILKVEADGKLDGAVADTFVSTTGSYTNTDPKADFVNVRIEAEKVVNTDVLTQNGNLPVVITANDAISGGSFKTDTDLQVQAVNGGIFAADFDGTTVDITAKGDIVASNVTAAKYAKVISTDGELDGLTVVAGSALTEADIAEKAEAIIAKGTWIVGGEYIAEQGNIKAEATVGSVVSAILTAKAGDTQISVNAEQEIDGIVISTPGDIFLTAYGITGGAYISEHGDIALTATGEDISGVYAKAKEGFVLIQTLVTEGGRKLDIIDTTADAHEFARIVASGNVIDSTAVSATADALIASAINYVHGYLFL